MDGLGPDTRTVVEMKRDRVRQIDVLLKELGTQHEALTSRINDLRDEREVMIEHLSRPTHGRDCSCTPCQETDWDEVDRRLDRGAAPATVADFVANCCGDPRCSNDCERDERC